MAKPVAQTKNIFKDFQVGPHRVQALHDVNIHVEASEFLAISGTSGSGKTTLLNLIGCLDQPTSGQIILDGQQVQMLNSKTLAHIRAHKIGFIFQTFNLLPVLTAFENVEYPLLLTKVGRQERRVRCQEALENVGLSEFANHRPDQLSGGQRQRVAIARAIVKRPRLILADEPTANLDHKTAFEVLNVMQELNAMGVTFILTSHDQSVLQKAKRIIHLTDGHLMEVSHAV